MAASTAAWTMLFGVVAIVLPPAPAWTSRYVPVHPAFLLRRHHRSSTGSSSCWASSESWPSLGRGSPQRSSPTLPLPMRLAEDGLGIRGLSLSRLNHRLPRCQADPEVM